MMRSKKHISNALIHILLAVLAILWLLPIFYVILTSFRAEPGSYKSYIWPRGFTLDNYVNLLTANTLINFPRWFLNTLIISFCTMIVSTLLILSVAYVMSRIQFKMRKPLMNIALVLGMFPGFMSMIAIYYILKGLGFLESGTLKQIALIMVYSGGAGLGFYIAKGFFDLIPTSLDEAAFLDGATKWDTFWQITVPLSKPIITYTLLGAFMGPWVDFIFAKVIMGNDIEHYTIAIGLWVMLEKEYVEYFYTQFYAGCVLISIPIAILFLLTQKYYVESMGGSVKG
ncbi:MAG: ABC transporter permease subunit [Candidatus Treponema excrementipullorum]|nr:ABC transporter permease subunit [Spirochaetia bacterium]MDD7012194.1 ABC transporter permease subunit [Candidatus Treponema excrementipullorum]MDY2756188.1 ABC transporter permease subunit [Candidatus Treponema excrementipullorum]MDY4466657.1 ABC transporter permease subunit [Candidatus Treponema excrementipullorum]MDY4707502.1 ABC transporter permease subunit [Candidatus Treponema excrementipullorum]